MLLWVIRLEQLLRSGHRHRQAYQEGHQEYNEWNSLPFERPGASNLNMSRPPVLDTLRGVVCLLSVHCLHCCLFCPSFSNITTSSHLSSFNLLLLGLHSLK